VVSRVPHLTFFIIPIGAHVYFPRTGAGFAVFSAAIDTYIRWDSPDEDVHRFAVDDILLAWY
jgi:hypothetical protein